MKKIRVLQILTSVDFGGVEKYVSLLARHLDPKRFEVEIAASSCSGRRDWLFSQGLVFHSVPHLKKAIDPFADLLAFVEIIKLIRAGHYDVVHTHMFKASLLGRLAAKISGVPVIIFTAHGFHFNTFDHQPLLKLVAYAFEKIMTLFSSMILTVSETEREQAIAQRVIPARKMRTVYPGIEMRKPSRDPKIMDQWRQRLGLSSQGMHVIGTVGRLAWQKDPLVLVRAADRLRRIRSDFKVIFVGDGPLRQIVADEIRRLDLDQYVYILGYCTDIDSLLGLMDLFVLPSRFEGQPISIMEAMLNQIPVVASDVNGVREIVRHDQTGWLIPPADPVALTEAVQVLLDDQERKLRLVHCAKKLLVDTYSVEQMVATIADIYSLLLASRDRRA